MSGITLTHQPPVWLQPRAPLFLPQDGSSSIYTEQVRIIPFASFSGHSPLYFVLERFHFFFFFCVCVCCCFAAHTILPVYPLSLCAPQNSKQYFTTCLKLQSRHWLSYRGGAWMNKRLWDVTNIINRAFAFTPFSSTCLWPRALPNTHTHTQIHNSYWSCGGLMLFSGWFKDPSLKGLAQGNAAE